MEGRININGDRYLQRDLHSKAIISTNQKELNTYELQRRKLEESKRIIEDISILQNRFDSLENDLTMIKNLLLKLTGVDI